MTRSRSITDLWEARRSDGTSYRKPRYKKGLRYRARYRDVAGRERTKHFARKIDAQHWLDSVTASMLSGTYIEPALGRTTVREYAQEWLPRQVHLKPTTYSRYECMLRVHVLPRFGNTQLSSIERSELSAWVSDLSNSGLAGPTVRHIYKLMHLVLQSAMLDGRLARNPAVSIKLPRNRIKDKRFLTHEEVVRLADAAGDDRLIVLVLAYCGIRFGELAALRVRNVDPLRRRLRIEESATEVNGVMVFGTPKSHHQREVPVPRRLIDDLAAACSNKQRDDLVFTAPLGGVIYLRNWRPRVFDPAVRAAGLSPLSPHQLRHTAASLGVAAGANVKAVQRMLGHASAAMTLDTYSGLFEDDLDAVADRLDEAAKHAASRSAASLIAGSQQIPADQLRTEAELIMLRNTSA